MPARAISAEPRAAPLAEDPPADLGPKRLHIVHPRPPAHPLPPGEPPPALSGPKPPQSPPPPPAAPRFPPGGEYGGAARGGKGGEPHQPVPGRLDLLAVGETGALGDGVDDVELARPGA